MRSRVEFKHFNPNLEARKIVNNEVLKFIKDCSGLCSGISKSMFRAIIKLDGKIYSTTIKYRKDDKTIVASKIRASDLYGSIHGAIEGFRELISHGDGAIRH